MKFLIKNIRVFSIITIFLLLFSTNAFAATQDTKITASEAANLAIFYYCLNAGDNSPVSLDEYVVTPLYDELGEVTYYSVDFFHKKASKGYVVIGADLEFVQCPEMSPEGISIYYEKALNGFLTIYYNPYEVFFADPEESEFSNLYTDVDESEVEGNLYEASIQENRALLQLVADEIDPLTYRSVISIHPVTFLQNIGYTNVSAGSYGTIETAMNNAGAFNCMYNVTRTTPYTIESTGCIVRNPDHCTITAISNVLMYWRPICCPNYPSTYDEMFTVVYNKAIQNEYFTNTYDGGGLTAEEIAELILQINTMYTYSGRAIRNYQQTEYSDWGFMMHYIDLGWPVLFGLIAPRNFTYTAHRTIAYGYTYVSGDRGDYYDEFAFVKFFDGHSTAGKYVCWEMLEFYSATEDPADQITFTMCAFRPY